MKKKPLLERARHAAGVMTGTLQVSKEQFGVDSDVERRLGMGTGCLAGKNCAWGFGELDNLDDNILAERGYEIYEYMMTDAQVRMAINYKRFAVISADWTVKRASNSPEHREQAEFTQWVLEAMKGSVVQTVFGIMNALAMGWSISEKVWIPVDGGKYNGRWRYDQIRPRNPFDYEFILDKFGNLVGLFLVNTTGTRTEIPMDHFLVYTYNPIYDRPYGQSDLRAVYKNWWSKDYLIKFWNMWLETHGMPTRIGKFDPATTQPGEQAKLLELLTDVQSNQAMTIPKDIDIEFKSASDKAAFDSAIRYHDSQIVKGVLGQTLSTGEGDKVGSLALGNVHQATLEDWITFLRRDIAETVMQEKIIKPLIDANYMGVTAYPKFVWQPRAGKISLTTVDDVTKLLNSGLVTEGDMNLLRERLDLSVSDAYDDKSKEILKPRAPEPGSNPDSEDIPMPEIPDMDDDMGEHPDEDDTTVNEQKFQKKETGRTAVEVTAWHPWRAYTQAEKRLGGNARFQKEDTFRRELEDDMMVDLSPVFEEMRNDMLSDISDALVDGKVSTSKIKNLKVSKKSYDKYIKTMIGYIGNLYVESYTQTLKDTEQPAASLPDVPENFAKVAVTLDPRPPAEIMAQIDRWSVAGDWKKVAKARERLLANEAKEYVDKFFITDVTDIEVLTQVKTAINATVSTGTSEAEMMAAVKKVFRKYTIQKGVTSAGRLRTIVRTNINKADNESYMAAAADPNVIRDFPYSQYTAILDAVTTEVCLSLDKKIFRSDDPDLAWLSPPKHHNCRSELIPVFFDDPVIEKGPSRKPNREDLPKGFGGTI